MDKIRRLGFIPLEYNRRDTIFEVIFHNKPNLEWILFNYSFLVSVLFFLIS